MGAEEQYIAYRISMKKHGAEPRVRANDHGSSITFGKKIMNTYQKVLVCIFRTIAVLSLFYGLISIGSTLVTMPGMIGASLFMFAPMIVVSCALYFGAFILARIVTSGIEG
jgi:hypothetical protein